MEKECPVCGAMFTDESWDGRHEYCPKCEREWDEDQRETYRRETGKEPGE